jgi:hypothetical protein
MIPSIRKAYNASFSEARYAGFLDHIAAEYNHRPSFRIAETPVFIPKRLGAHLFRACEDIADLICSPDFKQLTQGSIHDVYSVAQESDRTLFLQMDFGITRNDEGELFPQLIEVQGFPSLYFYQDLVANAYREFFDIPDNVTHLFDGLDSKSYMNLLRKSIIADEDPKQVVLLEIEPESQVTQIDFLGARHHLGLKIVCISDLKKDWAKVYYIDDSGNRVYVKRIFNRVIFDELMQRGDIKREFRFKQETDVHWVGHPNWFYRISKYTLPFIHSKYSPETQFVSDLKEIPTDLHNYVLKPLYSFAGAGVKLNITAQDLESLSKPEDYILQKKVEYIPVIETPDGNAKCEVRMLMLWEIGHARPRIINNLARLSKGEMIGVKYNLNKTWVGGSVAFFEGF